MGADETRSAGDEDTHAVHASLRWSGKVVIRAAHSRLVSEHACGHHRSGRVHRRPPEFGFGYVPRGPRNRQDCHSGDWTRVPDAVTKLELDITAPDVEVWADLLDGVDVLFHLAAEKYNSSRSTPQAVINTNISAPPPDSSRAPHGRRSARWCSHRRCTPTGPPDQARCVSRSL